MLVVMVMAVGLMVDDGGNDDGDDGDDITRNIMYIISNLSYQE